MKYAVRKVNGDWLAWRPGSGSRVPDTAFCIASDHLGAIESVDEDIAEAIYEYPDHPPAEAVGMWADANFEYAPWMVRPKSWE